MKYDVARYNQFVAVTLFISAGVNILVTGLIFILEAGFTLPRQVLVNPSSLLVTFFFGLLFGTFVSFSSGMFTLLIAAFLTQLKGSLRSILVPVGLVLVFAPHLACALWGAQALFEKRAMGDCTFCVEPSFNAASCVSILTIGLINTIALTYSIRARPLFVA